MKKLLKIVGIILIIIVAGIGILLMYVKVGLPDVGDAPDIHIEGTPEQIEHGRYLANEVMGCVGCHATRDYSKFAGPILEESKGSGGEKWDHSLGFPGTLYAPNITPTFLNDWTDGEIFRAITSGVDKDGNALFPIMPYHQYGRLPKEDIYAVIAYIRTLKPTSTEFPKRKLDFPVSLLVNTMPAEAEHDLTADINDPVKYGQYLVTAAACYDCHTQMNDKGAFIESMGFAGGMEFPMVTGGVVRSANLTPDKETGIGNWTKETFVNRFKIYSDSSYVLPVVNHNDFNTYMPWEYYSKLKTKDLEAMFTYLMTLDPITNKVEKFTPDR
jgi:hypothetical protein